MNGLLIIFVIALVIVLIILIKNLTEDQAREFVELCRDLKKRADEMPPSEAEAFVRNWFGEEVSKKYIRERALRNKL